MSSATSTSASALKPWQFFVLVGLGTATVGVVLARDASPASLIILTSAIGAAVLAAVALHRTLAPLAQRDHDVPELVGHRTRAALEREKMLALRSIKELEFDRAMGKIAAADFEEMVGRLRTRAIALMRQLDAGNASYAELIERELQGRLAGLGIKAAPGAPPTAVPRTAAPVASPNLATVERKGPMVVAALQCHLCDTLNDRDARFCKACGHPFEAGEARP
jgi:hypothetical protein